jgi:hypothetical protein
LSPEERVYVVYPPLSTPAFGQTQLRPLTTVDSATVADHHDRVVGDLISSYVVVQIDFITSYDDQSSNHPPDYNKRSAAG